MDILEALNNLILTISPNGHEVMTEDMVTLASVFAMIGSITGNLLINHKKKRGCVIWTIANILWVYVNIAGEMNIPQIVMFSVYSLLNIQGYKQWNKDDANGKV